MSVLERASSLPPRPSVPDGLRLEGDDLLTDLFEAIGDLHFIADPLEGADFVLSVALERLPSEVGLVSFFDIDRRQFVVVRQTGGEKSVLLQRVSEKATLIRRAMRSSCALVVGDSDGDRGVLDARWAAMGHSPATLICAPVQNHGRYLGLIELANPHDGAPYSASDGHALSYIGEQFAEFMANRTIDLNPELVLAGLEASQ
jgi:GAF domain-containing protein